MKIKINKTEPDPEDNSSDYSKSSSPLQLLIKTDKKRLMQVIINLVSNAIKFSSYNKSITLSAHVD